MKRVLPPQEVKSAPQPSRDIESNFGLRSVAYKKMRRMRGSETLSQSGTSKLFSRKQMKLDLVQEMRQLSKLRHPVRVICQIALLWLRNCMADVPLCFRPFAVHHYSHGRRHEPCE